MAESIFPDIFNHFSDRESTRLISSFGRYGDYRLNTLSELGARIIGVSGNEYACDLFLSLCYEILKIREVHFLRFPTALTPSVTEAIYLPDNNLIITKTDDGEINADEFVSVRPIEIERVKKANQLYNESLEEAKRWFAIASDLHFRLEKIYGEAMDFDKNEAILEEKLLEIAIILEKNT